MAFCSGESRPPEILFISTHKVHCGIKRSGIPRTTPSAFSRLATVIARFSRTLATTFAAGVPLVEALNSTAGAAGNSVYAKAIRRIRDDVTTGNTLYIAIKSTGLFPNMLLQMVSIGEESGALDDMLDKVATHYEEAVDNAVDSLSSLMEPLIMSVLGVLVGGLMIAMYLPIFMLGSVI